MQDTPLERWILEARDSVEKRAQELREIAARKNAAVISRAEHSRSPLGRFLKSKNGKRIVRGKRQVRWVSVPIDLDQQIVLEAEDVGLSISRFLAVCLALGVAQWPTYRTLTSEGPNGEPGVPVPKLVEHVLNQATSSKLAPPQAENSRLGAWHKDVLDAIMKSKPKKIKTVDPTRAVLEGTGIKE
ncbi:MAG: hypothetical protein KGL39_27295 [Patescibacteria group bacterium]|nr:hypothetical protein [Patescibacteria group bacterium]